MELQNVLPADIEKRSMEIIAGVALVELAWRFYSKGNRHEIFRHFFEKISEACSRWVNKN